MHGLELIGHRGARGLFPENTLEGFRATLALGVRAFELDVGVTRDGAVVVHHDPALNPAIARGPDGTWIEAPEAGPGPLLRDLTLAELRRLDVGRLRPGTAYAARFPDQVPRDGAGIPTLAEVLRLAPDARVTVEMKIIADHPDWTVPAEEMADRVLAVIDAEGAAARVTVCSFDWRASRHLRRRRPDLAFSWLTRAETVAHADTWIGRSIAGSIPEAVAEEGGGIWSPEYPDLTAAEREEARRIGLRVVPWTVNEPVDIAAMLALGVDGLITDRPDRVGRQLPDAA